MKVCSTVPQLVLTDTCCVVICLLTIQTVERMTDPSNTGYHKLYSQHATTLCQVLLSKIVSINNQTGDVAQLGEHVLGMSKVLGSIPSD